MSIEQPTTPPTITDLPPAPNSATDTLSEFDSKATVFVAGQVGLPPEQNASNAWVKETSDITYGNALESQVSATASAASAAESEQSARDSEASANYFGLWSSLTGSLNTGVSVGHEGGIWRLNVNLADVTTSEPSLTNNDWQLGMIRATDLQVEQGTQYTMPDSLQLNNFVKREWSTLTMPKTYNDSCWFNGKEYFIRNPVDDPTIAPPDRAGRSYIQLDGVSTYISLSRITINIGDTVKFKYLAPTKLTGSSQTLLDSDSLDSERLYITMGGGGVFFARDQFKLDGVTTGTNEKYPTDGLIHEVEYTATSTRAIANIGQDYNLSTKYNGFIFDFSVLSGDGDFLQNLPLRGNAIEGVNITKDTEFTWSKNFTLGTGWSIVKNSAIGVAGSQSILTVSLSGSLENNEVVRIVIDANIDAGSLTIQNSNHPTLNSSGIYDNSATMTSSENSLSIQKSSDFSGYIKNMTIIKGDTSANDGTINGSPSTNFDRNWQQSDGNQQIKKTAGTIKLNDTKLVLDSSNTYTIQSLSNASYGDEIVVVRSSDNEPTLVLDSADIADGKLIQYGFQTDTELTLDTNDTYTLFFNGVNLQVRRG